MFLCKVMTEFQNPALYSTDTSVTLCHIFLGGGEGAAIVALLPIIIAFIHIMLYSLTNFFCRFLSFLSHSPHGLSQSHVSSLSKHLACLSLHPPPVTPSVAPRRGLGRYSFSEMSEAELGEIRKRIDVCLSLFLPL